MTIEEIQALVANDMQRVNRMIGEHLHSEVALIDQLGHYIVRSGGKRLRPLLVLLAARACGYGGEQHCQLATIIEFIHTATLLHDDVVDASELRRGRQTANAVWGNEASVLVGDFLYSRAFQLMVTVNDMRVMHILADTTNTIAEGEVMQLLNAHNPDTSEDEYLRVILSKTAKLFEAASRLGAVVAGMPEKIEQALAAYGLHLGTAFQLIDDVLDYSADAAQTGKNIGDDLAEGKPTLPLIYAMRAGTSDQVQLIRQAIQEGGLQHIEQVLDAIQATGALQYARDAAAHEAKAAEACLQSLPRGPYRSALQALAELSVQRRY